MMEYLTQIFASSPDAIVSISMAGMVTSWNTGAERLFGYTADEIIGQPFSKLTDHLRTTDQPQKPAAVPEAYRDRLGSRLHRDGRPVPVTITTSLLRNPDGEVVGCAEFCRDGHGTYAPIITGGELLSPLAKSEREQIQMFTRQVLDTLFAFVAVLALDGTILEINRAPLEAAGTPAADAIGKKLWDSPWWNTTPDVRAQVISAYASALDGQAVRFDLPIALDAEGKTWIDFQLAPLRNEQGQITHLVGCGVDLSPRKAAEEQLRQNYLTYLSLIQNAPFGVYLVDSQFKIAQMSLGARKAFGKTSPVIGCDFSEIMHLVWPAERASEIVHQFRQTLKTGLAYRAPSLVEMRADNATVEAYDWQIERVVLPDGTLAVVCYFYDLTERQHYEEHVRQLMYEVAHRSKNLLGVVQSIARQTIVSNPLDFMVRFSQRLQSLSWNQDLLIANNWRGVGLYDLVRTQLGHFAPLIGNRIQVAGPPVQVMSATAQGIGMAVHELATNAGKYGALSNDRGRVTVTWTLDDADFAIQWSEEGGPAVLKPIQRGFGYNVISKLAEASVAGKVQLEFEQTGLTWSLHCPAQNVLEPRWPSA